MERESLEDEERKGEKGEERGGQEDGKRQRPALFRGIAVVFSFIETQPFK